MRSVQTSEGRQPVRTGPEPPPPDGILWDVVGEVRQLLMLPAALTLQVAHPAVGAGVDEHSVFRTDPWGRGGALTGQLPAVGLRRPGGGRGRAQTA